MLRGVTSTVAIPSTEASLKVKQIPRGGVAKTKPGKGAKPASNGPMPKTPGAK
jgi:hypothetical protein